MPAHLRNEPHLVLQYGRDLPIPIPDLHVDERGVSATLSFSQKPCMTIVPWSAVYVVTAEDGRGVLYQEDIPTDVSVIAAGAADPRQAGDGSDKNVAAREVEGDSRRPAGGAGRGSGVPDRPRTQTPSRPLRAVPLTGPLEEDHPALAAVAFGSAEGSSPEMPAQQPVGGLVSSSRRRRRPQLRLVK